MMDFLYNGGGGGHRGVWHWAEDGIVVRQVPQSVKEETDKVVDFHNPIFDTDKVAGREYYDGIERWRSPQVVYPILGYTTSTVTTPAHESYLGKAACNSVSLNPYGMDTNLKRIDSIYKTQTSKKNIGKHLILESGRAVKGPVALGVDTPPEPFCGHCYKKMVAKGLI